MRCTSGEMFGIKGRWPRKDSTEPSSSRSGVPGGVCMQRRARLNTAPSKAGWSMDGTDALSAAPKASICLLASSSGRKDAVCPLLVAVVGGDDDATTDDDGDEDDGDDGEAAGGKGSAVVATTAPTRAIVSRSHTSMAAKLTNPLCFGSRDKLRSCRKRDDDDDDDDEEEDEAGEDDPSLSLLSHRSPHPLFSSTEAKSATGKCGCKLLPPPVPAPLLPPLLLLLGLLLSYSFLRASHVARVT
mmetsp:Transcript_31793/g.58017  ORF Transcript_31793/g.58017 Transcript_31793/m.58017 type:complete len:243 (-) Transcript_31793:74-802(-)